MQLLLRTSKVILKYVLFRKKISTLSLTNTDLCYAFLCNVYLQIDFISKTISRTLKKNT